MGKWILKIYMRWPPSPSWARSIDQWIAEVTFVTCWYTFQVVAYQKLTLISILSGRRLNVRLPSVHSSIPHLCRPYSNLLQIAAEEDAEKFAATIAQMTPFLEKHSNLGLAKQVSFQAWSLYSSTGSFTDTYNHLAINDMQPNKSREKLDSLVALFSWFYLVAIFWNNSKIRIICSQALEFIRQKNVKKFQSTFVSLKLCSLASHLKLSVEEVEKRLRKMIISGDLSAQICKLKAKSRVKTIMLWPCQLSYQLSEGGGVRHLPIHDTLKFPPWSMVKKLGLEHGKFGFFHDHGLNFDYLITVMVKKITKLGRRPNGQQIVDILPPINLPLQVWF